MSENYNVSSLLNIEDLTSGLHPIKYYIDHFNIQHDTIKADKVANATANNFAKLDASGNIADSGVSVTEFMNLSGGATYSVATTTQAGLMSSEDKTKLNGIQSNANNYTLPTASSSTKGGVKIGTGLSMVNESLICTVTDTTYSVCDGINNGLMSAGDKIKLLGIQSNANNYTLPTASSSTKGGVKIGTGLSMNGDTLNCTLTGGEGTTYSVATTTQAGLMSATDKQHLDEVFQYSSNFTGAVLSVVGGKFFPSVSTVAEFCNFKNSNLKYFDSKLYNILNGENSKGQWKASFNDQDYQDNGTNIFIYYDDTNANGFNINKLRSSNGNDITLSTDNATLTYFYDGPWKLSETALITHQTDDRDKSGYTYHGADYVIYCKVDKNNTVAKVNSASINAATSNVESLAVSKYFDVIPSLYDSNSLLYLTTYNGYTASGDVYDSWYYTTIHFNTANGNATRVKTYTQIGTYNYSLPNKTTITMNMKNWYNKPSFSFIQALTSSSSPMLLIGNQGSNSYPFLMYDTEYYNASGNLAGGGKYVLIHHGCYGGSPALLQLETINSSGDTTVLNDWLEDDDNLICGIWSAKNTNDLYAITAKRGLYGYSSSWIDNYFTVWKFDFLTPRVLKTNINLTEIIDKLDI